MVITYVKIAQYHETDQMGVIHHSNYIKWMEEARVFFLDKIKLSYKKMEQIGIISPVMSISVDYKKPIKFSDEVVIIPSIKEYTGMKVIFDYKFFVNGVLCATAQSKHCFLRGEEFVSIKKDYPIYHKLIMDAIGKE